MQSSRNRVHRQNVTRRGNPSPAQSGSVSQGEEIGGVGSSYSAVLSERENKSLNRNAGPSGRPSANPSTLPNVGQGIRNTGKVG